MSTIRKYDVVFVNNKDRMMKAVAIRPIAARCPVTGTERWLVSLPDGSIGRKEVDSKTVLRVYKSPLMYS